MDLGKWIEEWQNRPIYRTLDERTLAEIPDDRLMQAILDFVWLKIGDDYEHEYEIVADLSQGFQAVYTTYYLETEVLNGGFNQYFWNPTGIFAVDALEGLRLVGATEHARIVEGAITIFIREMPELRKFRASGTLEAFSESYQHTTLGDLDLQFFALDSLSPFRIHYIRAHPEQFVGSVD